MAFALVEEPLEFVSDADTAHGNAFWTPSPAVVCREDLRSSEHVIEIVHRLSLPHKDNIRQLVTLWQSVYLIQDVSCCEVTLKALLARLTEEAVHLTAYLAGHAKRGAVIIGDEDCFDEFLGIRVLRIRRVIRSPHWKEILNGAIL